MEALYRGLATIFIKLLILASILLQISVRFIDNDRVFQATFVLVARDPLNRGSAFINPLEVEGPEEEELFEKGEHNKIRKVDFKLWGII